MKQHRFYQFSLSMIVMAYALCAGSLYALSGELQVDMQGQVGYSKHNFTDTQIPYEETDSWGELRLSYWLNEAKTISPFVSLSPAFTTSDNFWQEYLQASMGVQWYPFYDLEHLGPLKSIRAFAQYVVRDFPDLPSKTITTTFVGPGGPVSFTDVQKEDLEDEDFQIGIDYYYDNLFAFNPMTVVLWTKLAYYKTNFATNMDYNSINWQGDIKYGPMFIKGDSLIFPYVTAQWTYAPKYDERWFENFLRMGVGVRYYPRAMHPKAEEWGGFWKRFHLYGEYLHNVAYLQDSAPSKVKDDDFRIGLAFSTQGFYRE